MLTVDAVLIFPMLVWTITGSFTYFEGFRESASNLKAAYTVGDLISRETVDITETYLDSMHELSERMINNGTQLNMRVSGIRFDEADDRHYVEWSSACGYDAIWTNANVENMRDNLPPMPDQDFLVVVETTNRYEPTFNAVLGMRWVSEDHTFTNFVFTRLRFAPKIDGPNSLNFCA
ncbi:pilus assembly protein [Ruegeria sp.]|uniref:pilus assembly protein n=1 Tax=Ruegeria sp. TaxID=1879320 RepID=UPI003B5B8738